MTVRSRAKYSHLSKVEGDREDQLVWTGAGRREREGGGCAHRLQRHLVQEGAAVGGGDGRGQNSPIDGDGKGDGGGSRQAHPARLMGDDAAPDHLAILSQTVVGGSAAAACWRRRRGTHHRGGAAVILMGWTGYGLGSGNCGDHRLWSAGGARCRHWLCHGGRRGGRGWLFLRLLRRRLGWFSAYDVHAHMGRQVKRAGKGGDPHQQGQQHGMERQRQGGCPARKGRWREMKPCVPGIAHGLGLEKKSPGMETPSPVTRIRTSRSRRR